MLWFCSISNVFPSFFHILLSNEIITISFLLRFIEITLRGILGYQTILKSHLVRDVVKADHILSSSRLSYILMIKNKISGFPGGAVVGSLPANAGDTGSSPGLGGSHMPRSSWAREPQLLGLRVWSLCPAAGGAAIVKGPRTAMKSGPRTAMKSGPHLP